MRYLSVLLLVPIALGCSSGESQPAVAERSTGQTSQTTKEDPALAEIRQASKAFLTSVVRGDATEAVRWLTPKAAARAQSDPSVLAPLGFAVEKLQIGRVQIVAQGEAAAECQLTEKGANEPEAVCCLLKKAADGWRVCGMACDAGPEQPPAVISFEHDQQLPSRPPQTPQFVENQQANPPASGPEYRTATPDLGPRY